MVHPFWWFISVRKKHPSTSPYPSGATAEFWSLSRCCWDAQAIPGMQSSPTRSCQDTKPLPASARPQRNKRPGGPGGNGAGMIIRKYAKLATPRSLQQIFLGANAQRTTVSKGQKQDLEFIYLNLSYIDFSSAWMSLIIQLWIEDWWVIWQRMLDQESLWCGYSEFP